MTTQTNLRKAAVLIRSLDAETAAIMLGQLSQEEATAIRAAIRALGQIEEDEQADVVAEFRRTRPATAPAQVSGGVELELSSSITEMEQAAPSNFAQAGTSGERFQFLANASTSALVRFLVREHAQTIAVVLAHLAPARASAVLAELPEKLQAQTIERLSVLGETDAETVTVLERELAAWLSTRGDDRGRIARRRETVTNILAAADEKTRRGILGKLKIHNSSLAEQIAPKEIEQPIAEKTEPSISALRRRLSPLQAQSTTTKPVAVHTTAPAPQPRPAAPPLPRIEFDQLIHLDNAILTALLRSVDPTVLAIALASSQEELVDRFCAQMPKATARAFRRELRKLGPTRLSDMEAAQRALVEAAAMCLAQRRRPTTAVA